MRFALLPLSGSVQEAAGGKQLLALFAACSVTMGFGRVSFVELGFPRVPCKIPIQHSGKQSCKIEKHPGCQSHACAFAILLHLSHPDQLRVLPAMARNWSALTGLH